MSFFFGNYIADIIPGTTQRVNVSAQNTNSQIIPAINTLCENAVISLATEFKNDASKQLAKYHIELAYNMTNHPVNTYDLMSTNQNNNNPNAILDQLKIGLTILGVFTDPRFVNAKNLWNTNIVANLPSNQQHKYRA